MWLRLARARAATMFIKKRGGKKEEKEVPQWKRDMQAAEADAATSAVKAKRQREDEAAPASGDRAAGDRAAGDAWRHAGAACSGDTGGGSVAAVDSGSPPAPEDDDDDDDNFDPSAYQLEEDEEEEVAAVAGSGAPPPTAEQLLNIREARDAGKRKARTFYIDDEKGSMVKSLANERKDMQAELGRGKSANDFMQRGGANHLKAHTVAPGTGAPPFPR